MYIALFFLIAAVCTVFYKGCHMVRPTQRGLIESLGRYRRFAGPGFHWITPLFCKLRIVSVSEQLLDTLEQLVSTSDNVNAVIGAQVYIRVRPDEASVKAALFNTDRYDKQTLSLTRSALKNIVGKMPLRRLNCERDFINTELRRLLEAYTANMGIEVVRAEIQDIEFPRDVQESFIKVIKAEYEKKAAADFAAAAQKAADGIKQADIKKAEGQKQAKILAAEAEAKAIRIICEAAQQYGVGNPQLLSVLEASETTPNNNTNTAGPNSARFIEAMGDLSASFNEREQVGS